ncbi:MAG: hypothetical protein J5522_01175 [Lachnospiraceae bacterium]|nr:hypothetical protein [Lachnospiraceae bacterium]
MSFGDFAIAPSTTVTLCKGVPLVKGSEDTLYFASAGAQASTISSYGFATFTEYTYQRNARNVIRIGLPMGSSGANSALRANYCIFNNSAYEGKNIYCFVDSVDYVNNNTIDVTFTIDALQTFLFDFQLKSCYVEREHSLTDHVGDNLTPEEFGTLPAIINEASDASLFKRPSGTPKYTCAIYYIKNCGVGTDGTIDMETYDIDGRVANNIYTGTNFISVVGNAGDIDDEIEDIIHRGGSIVGVQMLPYGLITAADENNGVIKNVTMLKPSVMYDPNDPNLYYAPKNKKLMTYPYCYLTVSNNLGEERQYRWEWFSGVSEVQFTWYGAYLPTPDTALVPLNYKGMSVCYGEKVSYNTFPTCPWSEDSFQQWWLRNGNAYNAGIEQNFISTAISALGSMVVGAAVGAKFGPAGAAAGAAIGGGRAIASGYMAEQKMQAGLKDQAAAPDKLAGSPASAVVNEVIGNTGFTIYSMNIPLHLAKSIDDYFTMYGYATKRVKIPNISGRPVFNYVKTQGLTIYGDIPAPFAFEIQERFNSGVRFWKTTDVGNYSLNNSPA